MDAAVKALQNIRGLEFQYTGEQKASESTDMLDWLQLNFGFQVCFLDISTLLSIFNGIADIIFWFYFLYFWLQKDNVANQREHLILLLANVHIRQTPSPDPLNKVIDLVWLTILVNTLNKCQREMNIYLMLHVMLLLSSVIKHWKAL